MTIKLVKRPPDGAELRIEGKLDTATAPAAEKALVKIASEYRDLELNLSELAYVSSAGLRVLLTLQKQAFRSGGSLTLSHMTPAVAEIFEMTGFSDILNVV